MKRTESDPPASDEFSFDAKTSSVEVTRGEQLRNFYEEYVYTPALIAWDDRRTRFGGLLLLIYIFLALVGTRLYPEPALNQVELPPGSDLGAAGGQYIPPFETMAAPLGTDHAGRDVLAMSIHATPDMLLLVLSGATFTTILAILFGTVAGYKGGAVDRIITAISDTAVTIPGLPVVIVLAYGLQLENPILVGIIIMVNYWAGLARTLRAEVLKLREESYVEASRAMGLSTPRILFKDVIPNMMPFILVNFAFAARYVVFASVGLYYLGVLPVGMGNWGYQIDTAINSAFALSTPASNYLIIVPMIFIMLLALSLVLLAQGLDRVFNPRVRTRLAGESESMPGEEEAEEVVAGVGA